MDVEVLARSPALFRDRKRKLLFLDVGANLLLCGTPSELRQPNDLQPTVLILRIQIL